MITDTYPNKVIFLDIDGVLNSHYQDERLLPEALGNLNVLFVRTGANAVISSTWRIGHSLASIEHELLEAGCIVPVISATPILDGLPKSAEIAAWLEIRPEVEYYVILDDDPEAEYENHLVQVTGRDGLSADDVYLAEFILTCKKPMTIINHNIAK